MCWLTFDAEWVAFCVVRWLVNVYAYEWHKTYTVVDQPNYHLFIQHFAVVKGSLRAVIYDMCFCDLFEGTAIVPECMSASGGMMDELRNGLASLPCSNMEVLGASRRVPEAGNENLRFWPFCDVRLRRFLVVCRRVRTAYASWHPRRAKSPVTLRQKPEISHENVSGVACSPTEIRAVILPNKNIEHHFYIGLLATALKCSLFGICIVFSLLSVPSYRRFVEYFVLAECQDCVFISSLILRIVWN